MTADIPKSLLETLRNVYCISLNSGRKAAGLGGAMEHLFKKGLVPVQVESKHDGTTTMKMTVLNYQEKTISDAVLIPPQDVKFTQMPSMGGGE